MSIFSVLHQLDLIVMSIALSKRFICPLFEWRHHLSITWSLFDIYTDMLLLQIKILIIPPISFIPKQHNSINCDEKKKTVYPLTKYPALTWCWHSIYTVSVLSIKKSKPWTKSENRMLIHSTRSFKWLHVFFLSEKWLHLCEKKNGKAKEEIERFTCYVRLISLPNGLCCLCCWPHSLKNQASKYFLSPSSNQRSTR